MYLAFLTGLRIHYRLPRLLTDPLVVPRSRDREKPQLLGFLAVSRKRVLAAAVEEGADAPPEECSATCNLVLAGGVAAQDVLPGGEGEGGQFRRRGIGTLPTT